MSLILILSNKNVVLFEIVFLLWTKDSMPPFLRMFSIRTKKPTLNIQRVYCLFTRALCFLILNTLNLMKHFFLLRAVLRILERSTWSILFSFSSTSRNLNYMFPQNLRDLNLDKRTYLFVTSATELQNHPLSAKKGHLYVFLLDDSLQVTNEAILTLVNSFELDAIPYALCYHNDQLYVGSGNMLSIYVNGPRGFSLKMNYVVCLHGFCSLLRPNVPSFTLFMCLKITTTITILLLLSI